MIGDGVKVIHIVTDDHYGGSPFVSGGLGGTNDKFGTFDVEAGGWFIEEQNLGPQD